MKSLIHEAKEIIEMSLSVQINHEAYSLRANDWLKKVEAQETGEESHINNSEMSCALCGNDLVCPSCEGH